VTELNRSDDVHRAGAMESSEERRFQIVSGNR